MACLQQIAAVVIALEQHIAAPVAPGQHVPLSRVHAVQLRERHSVVARAAACGIDGGAELDGRADGRGRQEDHLAAIALPDACTKQSCALVSTVLLQSRPRIEVKLSALMPMDAHSMLSDNTHSAQLQHAAGKPAVGASLST